MSFFLPKIGHFQVLTNNFPKGYAFAHDTREKLHHLDEMSKRKVSLHNVSSFSWLIFIDLHLTHINILGTGLWPNRIQQHL